MISGITTLCFAASYGLALALEITRLSFRSGVRGALLIGIAVAGFVAHTLFLANRALLADGYPLSSPYDWFLVAAWMLVVVYLFELARRPREIMGLFLLPIILILIGISQFAGREPFPHAEASFVWATIHSLFLLLGTVCVLLGFVAGLMYLIQASRLRSGKPLAGRFRLPSLEWLEAVNSRTLPYSALLIAGGFLSGVILNYPRGRLSWGDPAILGLGGMLLWLTAASAFNALYRPARRGRKVAYLTVAGLVFLVVALGTLMLSNTKHVMATSHLPMDGPRRLEISFELESGLRARGLGGPTS